MQRREIKMIAKVYRRYKEIIFYLIFGFTATIVNWLIYSIMVKILHLPMTLSNISGWLTAVLFAYVTNKLYVFESSSWEPRLLTKEISLFFSARGLSAVVEIGGLPVLYYLGVNQRLFGVDGLVAKIILGVIVTIINYVFSKIIIFRVPEHLKHKE